MFADLFKLKAYTFERLVVEFMRVVELRLHKLFVKLVVDIYIMTHFVGQWPNGPNVLFTGLSAPSDLENASFGPQ